MPDLAQGYSADIVLNANESVRVSTPGQVTVTSAYGAPAGTSTINANTQTFGPYQVPAKLRITAVTGTANYAQPTQVPVTANPATGEFSPPVSGDGYRITGRNAVIVGHSRVQENFEQAANNIWSRPRWWNIGQALSGHRLDLIQNAGISGQSIAQIAARLNGSAGGVGFGLFHANSTVGNTTVGVLGLTQRPDVAFIAPAINDLLAGKSGAQAWSEVLATIVTPLRNAGIQVVVLTEEPASSSQPGYTTAIGLQCRAYRDAVVAYCATATGVYCVDVYSAMLSATSTTLEVASGDFRDGNLHANNLGGLKAGAALAAWIKSNVAPRSGILPENNYDTLTLLAGSNQLQVNPMFAGTWAVSGATGFSGTAAGSHLGAANFARSGAASAVLSAEARDDGKGQNLVFDTTFTAAGETIELRQSSIHAQAVFGAKYRAAALVSFSGPGGANLTAADNLRGVKLGIQVTVDGVNSFVYDLGELSTDVAYVGSQTFLLRTPELVIPAGAAITVFRPLFTIIANGAGSQRVKTSQMGLIRVA